MAVNQRRCRRANTQRLSTWVLYLELLTLWDNPSAQSFETLRSDHAAPILQIQCSLESVQSPFADKQAMCMLDIVSGSDGFSVVSGHHAAAARVKHRQECNAPSCSDSCNSALTATDCRQLHKDDLMMAAAQPVLAFGMLVAGTREWHAMRMRS